MDNNLCIPRTPTGVHVRLHSYQTGPLPISSRQGRSGSPSHLHLHSPVAATGEPLLQHCTHLPTLLPSPQSSIAILTHALFCCCCALSSSPPSCVLPVDFPQRLVRFRLLCSLSSVESSAGLGRPLFCLLLFDVFHVSCSCFHRFVNHLHLTSLSADMAFADSNSSAVFPQRTIPFPLLPNRNNTQPRSSHHAGPKNDHNNPHMFRSIA